jgi:acyl-coenzyme A synthetase/AMP-(fatty) acid ligase
MRDMVPNLTDYEKTYREFKWEIPEYYNFGFDGIDRWAEDRTKLALISVDDTGINAVRHTFYDLMRLSNQFANVLLKYVGKTLESPRCPREVEFLRELPKTTTGKIRRSELRSREMEKRKGS